MLRGGDSLKRKKSAWQSHALFDLASQKGFEPPTFRLLSERSVIFIAPLLHKITYTLFIILLMHSFIKLN